MSTCGRPKCGPNSAKAPARQKLVLDGFRQVLEFRLELRMKEHCPWHQLDNALEGIWFQVHKLARWRSESGAPRRRPSPGARLTQHLTRQMNPRGETTDPVDPFSGSHIALAAGQSKKCHLSGTGSRRSRRCIDRPDIALPNLGLEYCLLEGRRARAWRPFYFLALARQRRAPS